MTALYRCGRQADALNLYQETRRRLDDEQGARPGPDLSELHQRILRQDPDLAVTPIYRRRGDARQPNTLPPAAAEFIGREEEIVLLASGHGRAGKPSVKIIEGMPGVGKTALAVKAAHEVASRLPDAQIYINFGSHDAGKAPLNSADAVHLLLGMLDVPAARIPASPGERAARWRAELTYPEQIRPLLPAAGECLILITTRQRLHSLDGAQMLTLSVLPDHDAHALFTRIAGSEQAQDAPAVAEAVRLCGCLPLAIQLAAGRLSRDRGLSLTELVAGLSFSPGRAVHGSAAGDQVTSAFEMSFLGLTRGQQRLFRRLGLSPCSDITPYTAAALDGISLAVAESALGGLLDHHLLERTAAGRFRFHDLVRSYAITRAYRDDPEPERRRTVSRLLDYYLHTADRADRILYPNRRRLPVAIVPPATATSAMATPADAQIWLEAERQNILQAARHAGEHEWQQRCAGLAHVMAGFLEINGYWDEAIALHELALRSCRDLGDSRLIARAALDLSHVHQHAGRYQTAIQCAEEAAAIFRLLPDTRGEAEALHRLGTIQDHMANFSEALAYYHEARILYRTTSDQRGVADTLDHAAITSWRLGRYPEAARHLQEALELYRLGGDRRGEASVLNNIGEMQRRQGYHRDAVENYEQSAKIFEEMGAKQNRAVIRHNTGMVQQYKGNYAEAFTAYLSALRTYRETGDLRNQADVLNEIGTAYHGMGQYAEALAHHEKAKALADEIGDKYEQVLALRGIADARRETGNRDEAFEHYNDALRLAREIGDPYQQAKILDALAETILPTKGRQAARIYWRQAFDIFQRLGLPEAESVTIRLHSLGVEAS